MRTSTTGEEPQGDKTAVFWQALFLVACTCLSLNCSPTDESAELDLVVVPSGEAVPNGAKQCSPFEVSSCVGDFEEVLSVLQSGDWRDKLPGYVHLVRLSFNPGIYRVSSPIRLSWGHGSTRNIRLELAGPREGMQAILSGARSLGPASTFAVPYGIGEVVRFDLSAWPSLAPMPEIRFGPPNGPKMPELYLGDQRLPLAGWPNVGYGLIDRPAGTNPKDQNLFLVHGKKSVEWRSETDLRAFGYWFYDWAAESLRVSVTDNGALAISGKGARYGIKRGQRVRIENALSELDSPGEWYLDREKRALLVWPPRGEADLGFELSMNETILKIENSRGIQIHDLALEKARGDAVYVRDSDSVALDHVRIRHIGSRALAVYGGVNCGIRDSIVDDTGDSGIVLSGGSRVTLRSAHHYVEHTKISDFGRISKTYRAAVEMHGVGQRATGNLISGGPNMGILFTGNDHRISDNEIFDVAIETADSGAIYTGRDYTARGTIIEGNFLHDIRGVQGREVKGVYLDDQASGITIRRNIFARVQQPVYIGGGRDNVVEYNMFYASSPAIHLDARGLTWQRAATRAVHGELQARLRSVPYDRSPYIERYPNLAAIVDDDLGAPKYNRAVGNSFVRGRAFEVAPNALSGITVESNRYLGENAFANPLPKSGRNLRADFELARKVE